jgi:hypothetical protein
MIIFIVRVDREAKMRRKLVPLELFQEFINLGLLEVKNLYAFINYFLSDLVKRIRIFKEL